MDPFAQGVMVIGVGSGCRALNQFLSHRKEYRAQIRLGCATDTGDLTGKILREAPVPVLALQDLQQAVASLVGRQLQVPPMYSAKKVAGVRLHELARKGLQISRPPAQIEVYRAALLSYNEQIHEAVVDFEVSKGTYIRVLAEKLGDLLALPAHATALTRTRVGPFHLDTALRSDQTEFSSSILAALQRDTAIARASGFVV